MERECGILLLRKTERVLLVGRFEERQQHTSRRSRSTFFAGTGRLFRCPHASQR